MGLGYSQLFPCFNPAAAAAAANRKAEPEPEPDVVTGGESPDETLGHSFCYVPSSSRFLSPTNSDRFISPSQSLQFDSESVQKSRQSDTVFRSISGASVSANSSICRPVLQTDKFYEEGLGSESNFNYSNTSLSGVKGYDINGFESSSSFRALPLQPVPRGGVCGQASGGMDGTFFLSGPIESGALSGPLDSSGCLDGSNGVPFSAPLGGMSVKKKRRGISKIRKAFNRNFPEKKRPWVVPERSLINSRKEDSGGASTELELLSQSNVQWALGKAGEDRVHVVVSEEHGWLFVGIYDGFNGPDAPEFLMTNLYKTMYKELEGLFWDTEDTNSNIQVPVTAEILAVADDSGLADSNEPVDSNLGEASDIQIGEGTVGDTKDISLRECRDGGEVREIQSVGGTVGGVREIEEGNIESCLEVNTGSVKKVTFQSGEIEIRRRRLWELLAEENPEDGLDLSGSDRFAFSVDDAISVSNAGSGLSRRSLLLSKLKHGLSFKHKERTSLFPWKFGSTLKDKTEVEADEDEVEEQKSSRPGKRTKVGPLNPELVLRAMSRALEVTELAYLDMTDKVLDRHPELALMGSCLLVTLMRDEDVYVMNVGDSRAIVAQYEPEEAASVAEADVLSNSESNTGVVDQSANACGTGKKLGNMAPTQTKKLKALQLSTDHSTSIDEEVNRIKNEHPDDSNCISKDRVKGRLKVTRAFGAGFLKQPKMNDVLLEIFRNDYIGTAPYISCTPSLRHHKLCSGDQFLVLSSDGLYQYFSNQEVVSFIENFMEKFPDGDPAQHLIEELLVRAAKKAGMDFHELLQVPQGDRRQYHDDVTVMVVSLEGRIWKSSGKYP